MRTQHQHFSALSRLLHWLMAILILAMLFIGIGVYGIQYNADDIFFVIGFGAVGYILSRLGFHAAPLLLGLVLGPMIEENLRRALLLSRGSYMVFMERPISAAFLLAALLLLLSSVWSPWKAFKKRADATA